MNDNIKKYRFRDGLNLEFEIIDLEDTFKSKNQMMTIPHRAQFYHILWIEKGKGVHYVDFRPVSFEDNSILFIPSNSVSLYDKKGIYNGKAILFTDSFFAKNQKDIQFLRSSILYSDL